MKSTNFLQIAMMPRSIIFLREILIDSGSSNPTTTKILEKYSYVPMTDFSDWSAWSEPQKLAVNARGVDLVLQEEELHLAFIQTRDTDENLAGVYVQDVNMSRRTQPDPILVYASPYLRSVTLDNAHVDLAVDGDRWCGDRPVDRPRPLFPSFSFSPLGKRL